MTEGNEKPFLDADQTELSVLTIIKGHSLPFFVQKKEYLFKVII